MPYADPEARRAYLKTYYQRPEVKEREAGRLAAFRDAHRERLRPLKAAWARDKYRADPVAARERAKDWEARNPVRHRALAASQRANQKARYYGVEGRLRADDMEALWRAQPTCLACGVLSLGADHIVSMSDGGVNLPVNLQNLCWPCNQAKQYDRMRRKAV